MYLNWNKKIVTNFSDAHINSLYDEGYLFTRLGKGVMHQTRSVRVNLARFEPSSENRRVLKKNELEMKHETLPYADYSWQMGKLAKDFYDTKFGKRIFSANKIKELLTDPSKSNFNRVFVYSLIRANRRIVEPTGYCIALETNELIHYSYPFYGLQNIGMAMMTQAVVYAKEHKKQYIYLGSAQRPGDTYKLQFAGLEWFDGKQWQTDIKKLKSILDSPKRVHFIGICGVAMSALAIACKKAGWTVTGSDAGFFPPVSDALENAGVSFYPGWHPEKMGSPDLVIVGNVAGSANAEWLAVQEKKIPSLSYPEFIATYLIQPTSIVCAGTYGKTTTTALLAKILTQAGKNPNYMFGGIAIDAFDSARIDPAPRSGATTSVVEGDEYKSARWDMRPKFAHYSPTHLLLTGMSWDHADVYPTEASYQKAFDELLASMPKNAVIIQADKTYGPHPEAPWRYENIRQTANGIAFHIVHNQKTYRVESPMLGSYQAANIAGVFAMAHSLGIPAETILAAIKNFHGLKRRLEKRFDGHVTVFDDIAHSPAKAKSALATIRTIARGRVIAVFEPNTGNRKRASLPSYDGAFADADEVIIPLLTKVKKNTDDPDVSGEEIAAAIAKTHHNTRYMENDTALVAYLAQNAKAEDAIVFLGSHGFRGMINQLVISLRQLSPPPQHHLTPPQ